MGTGQRWVWLLVRHQCRVCEMSQMELETAVPVFSLRLQDALTHLPRDIRAFPTVLL